MAFFISKRLFNFRLRIYEVIKFLLVAPWSEVKITVIDFIELSVNCVFMRLDSVENMIVDTI